MDVFSPNTPRMLRSLVPNLVKKVAQYRLPTTEVSFAFVPSNSRDNIMLHTGFYCA